MPTHFIPAVAIALTVAPAFSSSRAEETDPKPEDIVFVEGGKPKLLSRQTTAWKQGV